MMKTGIRKRRFPSVLILFILILSTVLFTGCGGTENKEIRGKVNGKG